MKTLEELQPFPDEELYSLMVRDLRRNLNDPQGETGTSVYFESSASHP
jgi:hypothetical protein